MHVREAALTSPPSAIAIDVDHTLIHDDHTLRPATVAAVKRARADGIHVVLASSRCPRAMLPYIAQLGLDDGSLFVALQGALVCRYVADGSLQIERAEPMALADAAAVGALAAEHGATATWYRGADWIAERIDERVQREADVVGFGPEIRPLADERAAPEKILLVGDRGQSEQLRDAVRALSGRLAAERSNDRYVEITKAGVDKATGVGAVLEILELGADRLAAIGDGENDLGMFALAAVAVAPANASALVQAHATFVTDSNNDDGAAIAIRSLLS